MDKDCFERHEEGLGVSLDQSGVVIGMQGNKPTMIELTQEHNNGQGTKRKAPCHSVLRKQFGWQPTPTKDGMMGW